jgi:hypothetical protein
MSQFARCSRLVWIGLAAISCASCTQTAETFNPVQGKVLFKGEPLGGALVSFHPEAESKRDTPTGFTKPDGTFSVTTGQVEGALAGTYKVTFICSQIPEAAKGGGLSTGGMDTEDILKGAYANAEASKITVTIKEGPNQLEPFDLK